MKKTRINLLTSKQDYYKLEGYFDLFRKLLVGYCVLLFLTIFGLAGYRIYQSTQINNLNESKRSLLTQLSSRKEDEVKLIKLSKKLNSYLEFVKDDANFIPYYELLLTTLQQSSQSATLTGFNIDKSRDMSFTLQFANFEEMLNAFQFIESAEFSKNFSSLYMNSFSGRGESSDSSVASNYELSFEGSFKPINEKN